jgi:tRNA pseudouridine38-40 synthase
VHAFRLAYDGTPYHGFQRQPDVMTVEGRLLDALAALDVVEEGTPPGYAAAGRTDAGVSALAQTIAFEAPGWLDPAALNSGLPRSVRAWASASAPEEFHATHDATAREYTYYLHRRGPGGCYPDGLDGNRAARALAALAGEHDFHNLTPDETGTERDLSTGLDRAGDFFVLTVRSDGFPRQFVRRLVTLVAAIAAGERDTAFVDRVLSEESLSGPEGIGPASPAPLLLSEVEYPDLSFERDDDAATTAAELFERQRVEHAERAQVADALARGIDTGESEK